MPRSQQRNRFKGENQELGLGHNKFVMPFEKQTSSGL